jgi:RsiW-degrading membrane proteinase PrsW (M82 family)
VWLIFFDLEESEHHEPIMDLVYAFMVGAVTTFIALIIQVALMRVMPLWGVAPHDELGITLFSFVEELVKFLAVYYLVSRRSSFTKPIDAMIYMITVALGFAAVENIASLINQGSAAAALASARSLEVVVLRFLGATLLHTVTSGIVGFHWAIGWIRGHLFWFHIVIGLVIATSLHAVFNYLILTTGPASWALAFVAMISFVVLVDFEQLRTEEEELESQGTIFKKN